MSSEPPANRMRNHQHEKCLNQKEANCFRQKVGNLLLPKPQDLQSTGRGWSQAQAGKGQWALPSCLITAIDGMIYVPITNGGNTTLRRKNLKGNLEAVPWERATFDGQPNEEMFEILANIEPVNGQPNGRISERIANIQLE